jgi:hypothetical protein
MAATAPPRPSAARPATLRARLAALLRSPDRVLLVMAVLVAFAGSLDVLDDPDLWWHLRLGRWILDHHAVPHTELFSYTAQGNPMTAHEWGSEVLFTLVQSAGGVLAVALLMAVVGASAFVALALRVRRRGGSPMSAAVAVVLGIFAAASVMGTRPQVITVALVSWTLLLADRHLDRGGRLVWTLPLIGLVWANLHAGFVLGVGALALSVGLEALRRVLRHAGVAPWRRIGSLGAATVATAALGCLNPNGPGLFRYVLQTSSSERAKPITEWQSPNFGDAANLGLLVLLVTFVVFLVAGGTLAFGRAPAANAGVGEAPHGARQRADNRARPSLRDLGLAVAGMAGALVAVRNTSLAVVLALPAWAVMAQQVAGRVAAARGAGAARRTGGGSVVAGGVLIAVALAFAGTTVGLAAGSASESGIARLYPSCAATALSSAGGVRVFAPYFHSGYLVDRLWPRGRVYLYGESASLGTVVFVRYGEILGGGPTGLRLLADSGTNAALAGSGALHDTLAASPAWRAVLDDRSGLTLFATTQLAARLTVPRSCP